MIPPGTHASGEDIAWEREADPLEIEPTNLKKAVAYVAICALPVKHWPQEQGARHESRFDLGGFMGRAMPDDPGMA